MLGRGALFAAIVASTSLAHAQAAPIDYHTPGQGLYAVHFDTDGRATMFRFARPYGEGGSETCMLPCTLYLPPLPIEVRLPTVRDRIVVPVPQGGANYMVTIEGGHTSWRPIGTGMLAGGAALLVLSLGALIVGGLSGSAPLVEGSAAVAGGSLASIIVGAIFRHEPQRIASITPESPTLVVPPARRASERARDADRRTFQSRKVTK